MSDLIYEVFDDLLYQVVEMKRYFFQKNLLLIYIVNPLYYWMMDGIGLKSGIGLYNDREIKYVHPFYILKFLSSIKSLYKKYYSFIY